MARQFGWTGVIAILAMVGCGARDQGSGREGAKMDVIKPGDVERMIAADFPADGKIHIQSNGRFIIKPETLFCFYESEVDREIREIGILGVGLPGIEKMLREMGQDDYLDGSSRVRQIDPDNCKTSSQNVLMKGFAMRNRRGQPYKLILAVYQGANAAWVGGVEQSTGRRSDVQTGIPDPPMGGFEMTKSDLDRRHVELSIGHDIEDLARRFIGFCSNVRGGK